MLLYIGRHFPHLCEKRLGCTPERQLWQFRAISERALLFFVDSRHSPRIEIFRMLVGRLFRSRSRAVKYVDRWTSLPNPIHQCFTPEREETAMMRVNAIGITSTTTSTSEATATSRIEVATNSVPSSSIPYNGTVMEMDLMTDILWDFYEKFNGETNYLLIILYVPVMALAITANILVIAVVFKYHYMRRYVYNLVYVCVCVCVYVCVWVSGWVGGCIKRICKKEGEREPFSNVSSSDFT